MILRLFTNRFDFFALFEEQVRHAVAAARFFREVVAQDHVTEEMLTQMAEIEHQGDNAAHTIIRKFCHVIGQFRHYLLRNRPFGHGFPCLTVPSRDGIPVEVNGIDTNGLDIAASKVRRCRQQDSQSQG